MKKKKKISIILFGIQGSGKGTQAALLAEKYNIPNISPGAVYREEIRAKTKIGEVVSDYILKGQLAPDEVTNGIIELRLRNKDAAKGYILDGYPRTVNQLGFLESIEEVQHVFLIDIEDKLAVQRISKRRECPRCRRTYNLLYKLPQKKDLCDKCQVKLIHRTDDSPASIRKRLKIYHQQTFPLIQYYIGKGLLKRVDGNRDIKTIFKDIVKHIEKSNKTNKK